MTYLKNSLRLKITVFLLITALIFWLVPSNLVFGEGDDIETLQQDVTNAEAALANAETEATAANDALTAAQAIADEAAAELILAQAEADKATSELTAAQAVANEAFDALDIATQAAADAQAALDAAGENEDTTILEQVLTDANAELVTAQTAVDEATAKLAAAQAAANTTNSALDSAAAKTEEAQDTVEIAAIELKAANAKVDAAKLDLAAAQAALEAAIAASKDEENNNYDPTITTDKEDYAPEETVVMTGTGFIPNTVYDIIVTRPDGSVVKGDGTFTDGYDSVTSGLSGSFTYNYILDGISGTYQVEVKDEARDTIANTSFTDGTFIWDLAIGPQGPIPVTTGNIAEYKIAINGWAALVELNIEGLPTGAIATFDPNPVLIIMGLKESTLWIETPPGLTAKTYDFTVIARQINEPYEIVSAIGILEVEPDTTAPKGSININDGDAYTTTTSVTLNLSAADDVGVTGYRVANGNDASGAATTSVKSDTSITMNRNWILESGSGTRTVSIQYCDAAGNWSPNYTDTITLNTESTGSIRIRKYVREGLTGTFHFTLTQPGYDTHYASITINSGSDYGTIEVDGLHTGTWTVTETQNPDFVCTDPSSYVRSMYVGTTTVLADFTNVPSTATYALTIIKSGLLSGDLPYYADQAIFTLTGPGVNYTVTLDNDEGNNEWGIYNNETWSYLPVGNYTLNESYPDTNKNIYTSNPVLPITFMLDSNKTLDISNTVVAPGTVIIHKDVQTPTGGDVSDTTPTFHFNIDGGAAQAIHDGDAVTISGVTAGSHYVEETGAIPSGYSFYSISSTPAGSSSGQRVTFDVASGGTTHVYITNRQNTGTIIVQKVVRNFSGDVIDDNNTFYVVMNGEIKPFSQNSPASFTVPPGTYLPIEFPRGYMTVTSSVTVGPGETKYATITNWQFEGHITINKLGLQDAGNSSNDYSEFKLYQGGVQVPGTATAVLDNLASTLRPDTFTWDGLNWGTYTIVEEDGDGNYYTYTIVYDPSDTAVIDAENLSKTINIYNNDPVLNTAEITIDKTVVGTPNTSDFEFIINDGVNSTSVLIDGSGGTSSPITVEAGKTYTITEVDPGSDWDTIWSTTIPGATNVAGGITFAVTGSNVESINGKSVSFENTRKSATVTIEKDVIGPVLAADIFNFAATGLTPFALADGGSVNMTIESGLEYTVTETLPNTNWLSSIADDGNIYIISQTDNSITFEGTLDDEGDLQDSTITFTNTRKSGTVDVTKRIIDSLTEEDFPATYGTYSFGWSGSDATSDTFDLVSPGYLNTIAVWCGIAYRISETSTDPVLEIVTDPITFTATEGDNGTLTFYNKTGSITVLKVDETDGKALEGSTLRLFEADGTTPAIDAFGNPVGDKLTDADGKAYFTKLAFRTYVVEEISAPTGYSLADSIDVPVNGDPGNDVSIVMKDPRIPGRVTIIKTDPSGTPLDGAGFTIYYKASGNPVMPERFTSSGLVTFDGLEWGSYVIVETTPPAGYDTSDPVEITIDATNAESGVTVSRINTPTTTSTITTLGITSPVIEVLGISELPFTGLDPIIPISGISIIITGGLMVALSTIRKRFGK